MPSRNIDRLVTHRKPFPILSDTSSQCGVEVPYKLAAENYDLVFADIRMPGISGLEVAERLKASQPWLPVVIVTGYGTDANEARARAAGVPTFLRKPLSPEIIAGSAEQALLEKAAPAKAEAPAAPAAKTTGRLRSVGLAAKNVALFFAAPFVGLAYIVVAPFVGIAMLAWIGGRALRGRRNAE